MKTLFVLVFALAACGDDPQPFKPEVRKFPLEPILHASRTLGPIDGGTLLVTADGALAIAADPDRDIVSIVDLATASVTERIDLLEGDDPGRIAEDAVGNLYVVLRGAGEVLSFDRLATERFRVPVCAAPQGIAFDAALESLHVACDTGELVTLGRDGMVTRTVRLDRDLRDVVVVSSGLYVSRFRSAEVLRVDATGALAERIALPGAQGMRAAVAWRMVESGDQVLVVHQRARSSGQPVGVEQGAYGGNCTGPIVQTAVTRIDGAIITTTSSLPGLVLPVDVATRGTEVAVAAAGAREILADPVAATFTTDGFVAPDTIGGTGFERGFPGDCISFGGLTTFAPIRRPDSQIVAVAFASSGLVLQSRTPAELVLSDGRTIALATDTLRDTGHELFHLDAGLGVACASCHPGGREDSVAWEFADLGTRRTQDLRGGILGREPFHWNGDMADFHVLADEVFASRMGGPELPAEYVDALADFIDSVPPPERASAADPDAVARGEVLFRDATTQCASCHESGMQESVDVGTGLALQVPRLAGVASRTPLMHDGCAATLRDRFGACGGGDRHGTTSHLTTTQIDDLVAYLETL